MRTSQTCVNVHLKLAAVHFGTGHVSFVNKIPGDELIKSHSTLERKYTVVNSKCYDLATFFHPL